MTLKFKFCRLILTQIVWQSNVEITDQKSDAEFLSDLIDQGIECHPFRHLHIFHSLNNSVYPKSTGLSDKTGENLISPMH